MSVLIVFAVWFFSGFAAFQLIREEGATRRDMLMTTLLGGFSVLIVFAGWLATSEWLDKPYK